MQPALCRHCRGDRQLSAPAPRKPIVIEVLGGVVQDVQNVPPGYDYEIKDYDDIEADEDAAGRPHERAD